MLEAMYNSNVESLHKNVPINQLDTKNKIEITTGVREKKEIAIPKISTKEFIIHITPSDEKWNLS